jgi:hypothetical protein
VSAERRSVFDPDEFLVEPQFPCAADKVFTSDIEGFSNACVNWQRDGWSLYAAGYKRAADILVASIERTFRGHDLLVYPIVFLYRQHIELELKGLLQTCGQLLEIQEEGWQHHAIDKLWLRCRTHLEAISPGASATELAETGRLIAELATVDPTSFAFRYPEDKKGGLSLPGLTHINLGNVRDVAEKIELMLSCARAVVDRELEWKWDMATEHY